MNTNQGVSSRDGAAPRTELRILCAEDDPHLATILGQALRKSGCSVTCVENGAAALASVRSDPIGFDVLITDHQMPVLTGLQLVRELRAAAFRGRIIVHSSALPPVDDAAYRALGVDEILVKPANLASLLELVRRVANIGDLTDEALYEAVMRGREWDWERVHVVCLDRTRAQALGNLLVAKSSLQNEQAVAWAQVLQEMHPGLEVILPAQTKTAPG